MLFLERLIQDNEKVAAYSFIHSLATTLGMSIYEEVSVIVARETATEVSRGYKIGGTISKAQKATIGEIVKDLRNGDRDADIKRESEEALAADAKGGQHQKAGAVVDFYMNKDGIEHYFEIKTAKPNIDVFKESKTKLLEWVARRQKPVRVFLALPYNPYHPATYERFTETNMMDAPNDFLVGSEYWDFIGGDNTLTPLLDVFDDVGKNYKDQLQQKFRAVAKKQIDSKLTFTLLESVDLRPYHRIN